LKTSEGVFAAASRFFLIVIMGCILGACASQPTKNSVNMSPITKKAIQEVIAFNENVSKLAELKTLCVADFESRDHNSNIWFYQNCQEMNTILKKAPLQEAGALNGASRIAGYALEFLAQGELPPANLEEITNDFDYSRSKLKTLMTTIRSEMGSCYWNFAVSHKYMFVEKDCCTQYETYSLDTLTQTCKSK